MLYRVSGLDDLLQQHLVVYYMQCRVYTDSVFIIRTRIVVGYTSKLARDTGIIFRKDRNWAQTSVKKSYSDRTRQFRFNVFQRGIFVPNPQLLTCTRWSDALWNIRLFLLHGGQTCSYFLDVTPPIQKYLYSLYDWDPWLCMRLVRRASIFWFTSLQGGWTDPLS